MPGGSARAAPAGTATSPATTPARRTVRGRRAVMGRTSSGGRERDAREEAGPPMGIRRLGEYRDLGPQLSRGVPEPSVPLEKLGFLTIGLFDGDDPAPGHESTLQVIELGERLGFDSAWLRHRHLQYGISSPVAVLAAATQRTSRISLGTAVTPLAWENPLRLAEALATVDVLSGAGLTPGVSVGQPMHWDDVKAALYPDTADVEDFSYERVARLRRLIAGEPASSFRGKEGVVEEWSDRVQPHSPGLASRLWYGGALLKSAQWAGEHGMNFLTSSVISAGESA